MLIKEGIHLPTIADLTQCPCINFDRVLPKLVGIDEEDTRRIWLERRRASIGASDIPAIMGTAPGNYGSRYKLWHEKSGNIPIDTEMLEHQMFGHLMESTAVRALQAKHDITSQAVIVDPKGIGIRHNLFDWNVVSPDRIVFLKHAEYPALNLQTNPFWIPMEIKNVSEWKNGDWGKREIPENYYDQVQDQLEAMARPASLLLAIIGGNRLKVYTVFRDTQRGTQIMQEAEAFWHSISTGEEPPPDDSEATTEALKAIYPEAGAAASKLEISMTDEMVKWATQYVDADEKEEKEKERKTEAANNLRAAMKDHAKAKGTRFSVTWANQTRSNVNEERADKDDELVRLKEEVKRLEESYKEPKVIRMLKVTEIKQKS